jgi:hypothetical protein
LLSFLLEPDEYTSPQSLQTPQTPWHLNTAGLGKEAEDEAEQIITSLSHVQVVYYRPYSWLPALRAEISSHVANKSDVTFYGSSRNPTSVWYACSVRTLSAVHG